MNFEKFYLDTFHLMTKMKDTFDMIIKYKEIEKT